MMKRLSVASLATVVLVTGLGFANPASAEENVGITDSTVSENPVGEIPQETLAQARSTANPTPAPEPIVFAADSDEGIVASAPRPSSSASPTGPTRPPQPDMWLATGKKTDEFYPSAQGALRFAKTPAAAYGPEGQIVGYTWRMASGGPPGNYANSGTGLCRSDSEGRTISSPYPVPDYVCGKELDGSMSVSQMVCYFAPYGGLVTGSAAATANYSWGTSWNITAKRFLDRRYTEVWNGTSYQWVATNDYRPNMGRITYQDYRVTWGNCMSSIVPYKASKKCVLDILKVGLDGPYGVGLNNGNGVRNYFTDRVIPESVREFRWIQRPNGSIWSDTTSSPLRRAPSWNRLYGYGENPDSLRAYDNCNSVNYNILPTNMNFLGNWRMEQTATWATCDVIVYPTFGQRNFQGCRNSNTEVSNFNYIVTCNRSNPGADFVVTPTSSPDMRTNFSPEAQECYTVKCEWTNDPESTLPGSTFGQGNGIAVVKNEKNPRVLLRPGQKEGIIQVPADGSTNSVKYPKLKIDIPGKGIFTPGRTGEQWGVYEVNRSSSPWYIRNGERVANPNNEYQPFQSEVAGKEGILSVNPERSPSLLPYCVPGLETCLYRRDIASIAGPEGTPIVGPPWQRELNMNFYRPIEGKTSEVQKFTVRALYHETWRQRIATPGVTSFNPLTGVRTWSGSAKNYTVTATCATDWTDLQALSSRPSP